MKPAPSLERPRKVVQLPGMCEPLDSGMHRAHRWLWAVFAANCHDARTSRTVPARCKRLLYCTYFFIRFNLLEFINFRSLSGRSRLSLLALASLSSRCFCFLFLFSVRILLMISDSWICACILNFSRLLEA